MDKILKRRRRYNHSRLSVVNPDENFHFYWLLVLTTCVLYNLWTLIVRQSFPELQVQQQWLPKFNNLNREIHFKLSSSKYVKNSSSVTRNFISFQTKIPNFWFSCDCLSDIIFIVDIAVQLRTGYLEQGLMVNLTDFHVIKLVNNHTGNKTQVYDDKKLATHYMRSRNFLLDLAALIPLDLLQLRLGTQPLLRFPRFFKVNYS